MQWQLADRFSAPRVEDWLAVLRGRGIPSAIAISPQGDLVAASIVPGGADSLMVWGGDRLLYRRDGETDFALAFSPDGTTLATASSARDSVRLLRASDGELVAERRLLVDAL